MHSLYEAKKVKCWLVKPPKTPWSVINARRFTQIRASGGTPASLKDTLFFYLLSNHSNLR